MRRLARRAVWSVTWFLLSLTLLAVTACAGEIPVVQNTPTPELEVVVFATEAPTPATKSTNGFDHSTIASASAGFAVDRKA